MASVSRFSKNQQPTKKSAQPAAVLGVRVADKVSRAA
jgi:hypothetical protein